MLCIHIFSINCCYGVIGDQEENVCYGRIESKFYLHVPSLLFLAAKDLSENATLPYQAVKDYAQWIKMLRSFCHNQDITYDCPDNVFYNLNKRKNSNSDDSNLYYQAFSYCPYVRKALIMHGVSFLPGVGLKDIRQDIPDDPDQTLHSIHCSDISPADALLKASCLNHPETLAVILTHHRLSTLDKKRAFKAAVDCNTPKTCQVLFNSIDGFRKEQMNNFLLSAAAKGANDSITFLLEHGADAADCLDMSLINASEYVHFETVKLLLNLGADVKAYDQMALRSVVVHDFDWREQPNKAKAAIIRDLLKYGADINVLEQAQQEVYRKLLVQYPEPAQTTVSITASCGTQK